MAINKNYIILLGFVIIGLFLPLGFVPLFDLDEGAFSEATREMLVGKDYITTYLNGELRFDKPILIYWLQLMSVKIFGLNEFAVRFPSALAGAFWVLLVYAFTKKHLEDKNTAFKAALFMIASLQIMLISKAAIADALLNLWLTATMFAMYEFFKTKENKYLYLVFLFAGFGMLTKGPVAVMIPLVVGFIYCVFKKEYRFYFTSLFNIKAIALFLVICMPWYIAEYMAQGQLFIDGFFLKHNVGRFSDAMEKHAGPIYYFIPVLLLGFVPFSAYIFKAFKGIVGDFKNDITLYLWIWFIFVFIFFSLSSTKLPHYVIYGYTPLFILIARFTFNKKIWVFIPWFVFAFLMIALFIAMPFGEDLAKDTFSKALLAEADLSFVFLLFFLLTLGLSFYIIKKQWEEKNIVLALGAFAIIGFNYIVLPAFGSVLQQPIKDLALYAKKNEMTPVIYGVNTPSFNFYLEKVLERRAPNIGEIAYTKIQKFKKINKDKSYEVVKQRGAYLLVKKVK